MYWAASFHLFILSSMLRYYRDYSYWFFLLYYSVISRSFLNFSTLPAFIFPALRAFLFAFSQLMWSCSSSRCFEGFRLLVSIKPTTDTEIIDWNVAWLVFRLVEEPRLLKITATYHTLLLFVRLTAQRYRFYFNLSCHTFGRLPLVYHKVIAWHLGNHVKTDIYPHR